MHKNILSYSLCSLIISSLVNSASARAPIQASYTYQLESNSSESVSIGRISARGGAPLYRKNGSLLVLGVRYSMDSYHFENTTADWEKVHNTELGLGFRWRINDQWLWANYSSFGLSAEESAEKNDAYRCPRNDPNRALWGRRDGILRIWSVFFCYDF